ncbi:hypothetical protein ABK905_05035 [Acerihabitans sp. KWT182]|uniref:Transposase n=1 Tax=Acerihabitans sp. KWT182 TaxID=3157919 RepID=A0AAU7QCI2_9GAMM
MTSNIVLPMIQEAEHRFGASHSKTIAVERKSWLGKLKMSKRNAFPQEDEFVKRLRLQASHGCLKGLPKKGQMPKSNVTLDETVIQKAEEKIYDFSNGNPDNFTPLMQAVATDKGLSYVKYLFYATN